ncbi:TadE-like protein [Pseudobythopirellula maris]|uniref:TadE-like protein n=1 Tax=Pseudobythopirellula maris TaxID=2527991 RepID=A0A5C5ZIL0_9BACT|nr:TadE family protein [Pseudobythopirellula maris]TWT86837.1 TadE-like protein [Pseudobythopirellula maris]
MTHTKRRPTPARRGATTVEFALVAPLFFLVLFSMFEFTWMNVMRHTADNAAYEAARRVIVPGANVAEAEAEANRLLRIVGARDARVTVAPRTITRATERVTVTVEIPMSSNALVAPKFTGSSTIRAVSTQRTQRANSI